MKYLILGTWISIFKGKLHLH